MPNNKPEDLFQLIKSLNRSEKGYFKKFVSTHAKGEAIYLRLFDAIEKQKDLCYFRQQYSKNFPASVL